MEITDPSISVQVLTQLATMAVPGANNMILYDPSSLKASFKSVKKPFTKNFFTLDNVSAVDRTASAIFRFTVNPTKISVKKKKVKAMTPTKSGWDYQYFRNDLVNISYNGNTGYIQPPYSWVKQLPGHIENIQPDSVVGKVVNDARLSPTWLRFQRLQEFFDSVTGDIMMIHDGIFYLGFMDDFNWDQDSSRPHGIYWSFSFMAYPDKIINIFNKVPSVLTSF